MGMAELKKQLSGQEKKLLMLETKKNAQVDKQQKLENECLDYNLKSAYQKAIDMDFLYAEQIEEQKRIIKNQKARIKRLTKWILADDEGVMKQGTYTECRAAILTWTKTEEAKETYSRKELKDLYNYFDCAITKADFMGFYIFPESELEFCNFESEVK
jgi:hypothetical protein